MNTYECIRTFIGHEYQVLAIDKISDHQIVSCSVDETIRIWDLNTGECLKILRGHEDWSTCVTVISEKKIICGTKGGIKILDVETGECLKTLNGGRTNYIYLIIILSYDKIARGDEGGKIVIWNINNGESLKTINAHSDCIYSLVKLSKNKIISCSGDKIMKYGIWRVDFA